MNKFCILKRLFLLISCFLFSGIGRAFGSEQEFLGYEGTGGSGRGNPALKLSDLGMTEGEWKANKQGRMYQEEEPTEEIRQIIDSEKKKNLKGKASSPKADKDSNSAQRGNPS